MKKAVLLAASCVAPGVACAAMRPLGPGEQRGLYEVGYEANHFTPCDPGYGKAVTWPVRMDSSLRAQVNRSTFSRGSYNSVVYYVRWRGDLRQPDTGVPRRIGVERPRWLQVTELLEARAPRRGECGWPGG